MEVKLFDAELKVMDVLWEKGDTPAREIARKLTEELGWNVNTTYTLIKRCINKGAIRRSEPGPASAWTPMSSPSSPRTVPGSCR